MAWLALAYGWLKLYAHTGRKPLLWGWRLLAGLAAIHAPLFQLVVANPLWTADPVVGPAPTHEYEAMGVYSVTVSIRTSSSSTTAFR